MHHDLDESPDARVERLIVSKAREDAADGHLRDCPELAVAHGTAEDGGCGCDTGCEYVRLEADLSCPHGHTERFQYGEFGDLADLIDEMLKEPAQRFQVGPFGDIIQREF